MDNIQQQEGSWLSRFNARAEFDRFSIISVGFLIIGIVGGVTVGISAFEHIWQIGVIAGITMLSLSLMLAVAPIKWILRSIVAAVAIDLLIILINLL